MRHHSGRSFGHTQRSNAVLCAPRDEMRTHRVLVCLLGVAALLGDSRGSAATPGPATTCQTYLLSDLRPGQRFQEVRKKLGSKWRSLRAEKGTLGTETSLTYLNLPLSTTVLFDQNPVLQSSATVLSIRICSATPGTLASELLNGEGQHWGSPVSGGENIQKAQQSGPTVWRTPACGLELEAFRRSREWWEQTDDALCVELRAASNAPEIVPPPVVETAALPVQLESSDAEADELLVPARLVATPATLLTSVAPTYPANAQRGSTVAHVVIVAMVTETGAIENPRVLESTVPDQGFEAAAIAAIRQWKYQPATHRGIPVAQQIKVAVDFR